MGEWKRAVAQREKIEWRRVLVDNYKRIDNFKLRCPLLKFNLENP